MDDLISRAVAMDEMSKQQTYKMFVGEDTVYLDANDVGSVLASLPAAQPKRNPGRWVSVGCVVPSIANVPMIKCTVCGHLEPDVDAARTPYCSHCGAYMKGGRG